MARPGRSGRACRAPAWAQAFRSACRKAGSPTDPALRGKHFFIEHLAQRLEAMERGAEPMKAVAYRLYARRLREAMAGYPEARLAESLAHAHPAVAEALAVRHFDTHGVLPGAQAGAVLKAARSALERMRRPAP